MMKSVQSVNSHAAFAKASIRSSVGKAFTKVDFLRKQPGVTLEHIYRKCTGSFGSHFVGRVTGKNLSLSLSLSSWPIEVGGPLSTP